MTAQSGALILAVFCTNKEPNYHRETPHCVCAVCLLLVSVTGVCYWCLLLVSVTGVCYWCIRPAVTGVCYWCLLLVYLPCCYWCVLLVCVTGVCYWCIRPAVTGVSASQTPPSSTSSYDSVLQAWTRQTAVMHRT